MMEVILRLLLNHKGVWLQVLSSDQIVVETLEQFNVVALHVALLVQPDIVLHVVYLVREEDRIHRVC